MEMGNNWTSSGTAPVLWKTTDNASYGGPDIQGNALVLNVVPQGAPTGISAVANATLTATQMLGGAVSLGGTIGAFTNTTATAAQLVATLPSPSPRKLVDLLIINANNGDMTLQAGVGVTVEGNTSGASTFDIPTGTTRMFKMFFQVVEPGTEAVVIFG
jgi:hypothetical protein